MFNVIVNQIIVLSIIVFIGYLARKFRLFDDTVKDGLSKIVIKVTFPILILVSVTNLKITFNMMENALLVLVFTYAFLLILMFVGIISAKAFKLEGITKNSHVASIMFGNVVFLGFPLFTAMYPNGEGVFYAIFFYLAADSLLWTIGVMILNKHNSMDFKSSFKHLLNLNTIAFSIAIIMLLLGIKLPSTLNTSLSGLGHTTPYLAMLFVGVTLADINIKGLYKKPSVFMVSVFKTIIMPMIVIFIMRIILNMGLVLDDTALIVLILQVAMPSMVTVAVVAKESKSDYIYVTECIFVSTIISLVSLPFIYYIAEKILL